MIVIKKGNVILAKIRQSFLLSKLKLSAKLRKIDLSIGKNIKIIQNTVIKGKGSITIGNNCSIGVKNGGYYYNGISELQLRGKNSNITIGEEVLINNNLFVCCMCEVNIESHTLIGEGVMIMDFDAHGINKNERITSIGNVRPIYIGENVWIGSKAIILAGTIIGKNSIVGAGAVVKGIFPENVIIAGNPAKMVKSIE